MTTEPYDDIFKSALRSCYTDTDSNVGLYHQNYQASLPKLPHGCIPGYLFFFVSASDSSKNASQTLTNDT
jgi:hypothetical protein